MWGRVLAIPAAVLAAAGLAVPALAQDAATIRPVPTITVEGEASEDFLPDRAILSLGVVTELPRASEAANQNSKAVKGVIEAVKQAGIEPRAIQSTSVSLEPIFKQSQGGGQTVTAFRASNRLEVEVTPPDRAGLLAGMLIDKGVNTIDDIRFASSANAERADRLRGLAMRDARHKAETYVAAIGLTLGKVTNIAPNASEPRPMLAMAKRVRSSAPVAVPLEAGQQSESAGVSVTWEIVEHQAGP